ncbi:MAG: hypothetical protein JWR01_1938 [Subtercola sp.]|nr:hypothetical protein [Subtercola sp.]
MKLAKLLAGAAVALLLGSGVVALGGGVSASAAGRPGQHQPVVCKMANGGSGAIDTTGLCPHIDPRTGTAAIGWDPASYKYYDDVSPFAPLVDPLKFPKSDGGLNCDLQNDGVLQCWRYVSSAVTAGRDNCDLTQLKDPNSFACRGSVMTAVLEKDEAISSGGGRVCTPETIYYGRGASGQPRYLSEAMQCYDSAGLPTVPTVIWYKNDGKGRGHLGTVIGTTQGYLTAPGVADAFSEPAASVTTTTTLSPGSMTAPGDRADFTVTVRSVSAGSVVVTLKNGGFQDGVEDTIPSDWMRLTPLSAEYITYLIPHVNAGQTATASLHFTVTALNQAFVWTDVNGANASSSIIVRPAAPTCTVPDSVDGAALAVGGSQPTILPGVSCTVQHSTTLTAWTGNERGAGTFIVDGEQIRYRPASTDFRGSDTIYVYTSNEGGVASLPTAIHVNVVDPAAPVGDEYTMKMETRLVVDAEHGLMANDTFPGGADAWTVVSNGTEYDGAVRIGEHGELTVEPGRRFTGDLTFQYKLGAAHGQGTDPATVTIHVVE